MHDRLTLGANWDEGRLLEWFRQLADAVSKIHSKNYAHRDIKPLNIFLTESDEIRLGDFGEANFIREKLVTTYPRGTTKYIPSPLRADVRSPMQVSKACGYSHDIWSLGRTFYEMCMGRYAPEFEERPGDTEFGLQIVTYNLNVKGFSSQLVKLITDMLSVEVIPMTIGKVAEEVARLIAAREPLRPVELASEETLPVSFTSLQPPRIMRCQFGDQHPKELHTFQCGHTFCKSCMELKCAQQGGYFCPLCLAP